MIESPRSKLIRLEAVGTLKEGFEMPTLDVRVLASAQKFSALGATVSKVSIPFHPVSNAIQTIEQRISSCFTLKGKSHGRFWAS
jgi:hypothetical protein